MEGKRRSKQVKRDSKRRYRKRERKGGGGVTGGEEKVELWSERTKWKLKAYVFRIDIGSVTVIYRVPCSSGDFDYFGVPASLRLSIRVPKLNWDHCVSSVELSSFLLFLVSRKTHTRDLKQRALVPAISSTSARVTIVQPFTMSLFDQPLSSLSPNNETSTSSSNNQESRLIPSESIQLY